MCVFLLCNCMSLTDSHYVFIQGSNIVMCTLERKFLCFISLHQMCTEVRMTEKKAYVEKRERMHGQYTDQLKGSIRSIFMTDTSTSFVKRLVNIEVFLSSVTSSINKVQTNRIQMFRRKRFEFLSSMKLQGRKTFALQSVKSN